MPTVRRRKFSKSAVRRTSWSFADAAAASSVAARASAAEAAACRRDSSASTSASAAVCDTTGRETPILAICGPGSVAALSAQRPHPAPGPPGSTARSLGPAAPWRGASSLPQPRAWPPARQGLRQGRRQPDLRPSRRSRRARLITSVARLRTAARRTGCARANGAGLDVRAAAHEEAWRERSILAGLGLAGTWCNWASSEDGRCADRGPMSRDASRAFSWPLPASAHTACHIAHPFATQSTSAVPT
jgi:hypothetical protein